MKNEKVFKNITEFLSLIAVLRFAIYCVLFFIFGQEALYIFMGLFLIFFFSDSFKFYKEREQAMTKERFTLFYHSVFRNGIIILSGFLSCFFMDIPNYQALFYPLTYSFFVLGFSSMILEKKKILSRENKKDGYTSGTYLVIGLILSISQMFVGNNIGMFFFLIIQPMFTLLVIIYSKDEKNASKYLKYCLDSYITKQKIKMKEYNDKKLNNI